MEEINKVMAEVNGTAIPEQAQEGTPAATKVAKVAAPKIAEETAETTHKEQMRQLELEAKRLEILEKKINIEDAQERIAERQLRRDAVSQKAYTNGATLRDTATREAQVQKRCNHRKGGDGAAGIQLGQGQSSNFAVIKHTMLTGDMWLRCQRCGKTWKPPIKSDFMPGGLYEEKGIEGYVATLTEYEAMRNCQTSNKPSSSQQFQWSDNGAYAREVLRHTTLR
jgi:hypothetical protein